MTTQHAHSPSASPQTGAVALLVVAFGAAAGALLRWRIGTASADTSFPWSTLTINVVGCFLLGSLPAVSTLRRSPYLPLLLGPGLLGGFTTVSTWAVESRDLVADAHAGTAGLYVAATLVSCLGAAAAGRLVVGSTVGSGAGPSR